MKRRTFIKIGATAAATASLPLVEQLRQSRAQAIDPSQLALRPDKQNLVISACDMCGAQDPIFLQVERGQGRGNVCQTQLHATQARRSAEKRTPLWRRRITRIGSPNR